MSSRKKRSSAATPMIPPAKPKPGDKPAEPERHEAAYSTKAALRMIQERMSGEIEALVGQAAKDEGFPLEEGWKLDLSGFWHRPGQPAAEKKANR